MILKTLLKKSTTSIVFSFLFKVTIVRFEYIYYLKADKGLSIIKMKYQLLGYHSDLSPLSWKRLFNLDFMQSYR
ncbi:MAG: hypothetical protein K8T10_11350 [Candidatus Eremiobacteraeota bacterium]|nr:hypothetical protein [Candidatus Eremiobacteraeota bacterium]